jgi:hypothetical protein
MLKKKNSKVASCINHFDLPPDRIAKTARCAARISLPAYYKVSNIKPDQKRTEESKDDMIQKGFFFFFFFLPPRTRLHRTVRELKTEGHIWERLRNVEVKVVQCMGFLFS